MAASTESVETSIRGLLAAGDRRGATTLALRAYGEEIAGFLVAAERNEVAGAEAFSAFCEDLWRGIDGFRGASSFRTWAYCLARNAARRRRRDPFFRRGVPLSEVPEVFELAERIRTTTLAHLRTEAREAVDRLRDRLDDEDRELLVLRVNRRMSWPEIAAVLDGPGASPEAARRRAAALRKRYERVKARIREMARAEGLLDGRRDE